MYLSVHLPIYLFIFLSIYLYMPTFTDITRAYSRKGTFHKDAEVNQAQHLHTAHVGKIWINQKYRRHMRPVCTKQIVNQAVDSEVSVDHSA